jgi:hypothetical protein
LTTGANPESDSSDAKRRGIEPARKPGRLKRFLKGFVVFLVLGPPIGLWTYSTCYLLFFTPVSGLDLVEKLVLGGIIGIPFSYAFGHIPAALAGLVIALLQVLYRSFGILEVGLIGLAIGISFALIVDRRPDDYLSYGLAYTAVKAVTCVVPTIVCWLVIRRWRITAESSRN